MVETINKLIEKFESAIAYQDRRCEYLDGVFAKYNNQIFPDKQLEVKQEDYDDNSEDAEMYDATKIEEAESYLGELKMELLMCLRRNNVTEMKITRYRRMVRNGITVECRQKPITDLTDESGQTSDNLPQQQMKNLSISN